MGIRSDQEAFFQSILKQYNSRPCCSAFLHADICSSNTAAPVSLAMYNESHTLDKGAKDRYGINKKYV